MTLPTERVKRRRNGALYRPTDRLSTREDFPGSEPWRAYRKIRRQIEPVSASATRPLL
ncbi:MAG TPA: hypothetical protein VNA04_18575 [Thermoanaerobaculia bacterium]|nr:hypothetical protein [Thermoanaerobaculia bacterium]